MRFDEWQSAAGAYWPNRRERLIYAIQRLPPADEFDRLPLMGWICTIKLMGEMATGKGD
jgi:hypothetical protein